jgi:hypothetical protein
MRQHCFSEIDSHPGHENISIEEKPMDKDEADSTSEKPYKKNSWSNQAIL